VRELAAKRQAINLPRRRSLPRRVAVAAALMLVAGAVALFGLRGPERVYGLEGLKDRLLALRSLHIMGGVYQQTTTEFGKATLRFPTETFHERPDRQYHRHYGFSSNADDKLVNVTRSTVVGDRSRMMFVDHDGKRAVIAPTDELNAELAVEQMLQQSLIEKLGQGAPEDYRQVGSERIGQVPCDVYEYAEPAGAPIRFRTKLWLNPADGMPVKLAGYVIKEDEAEDELFFEWSEIALNVEPPAEMFSFDVPAGYEKIEPPAGTPAPPLPAMTSGAGVGDFYFSAWVGLNIDDRAVLVCWTGRTGQGDEAKWFDKTPDFTLVADKRRSCDETTLWTGKVGGDHWRWSLIVPKDGEPVGDASLDIRRQEKGDAASLDTLPLAFPEQRLATLVEEVQRRTLPAGAAEPEIWTLPELRAKLAAR
jgi:outer membrane lipoprotein-sorting protein